MEMEMWARMSKPRTLAPREHTQVAQIAMRCSKLHCFTLNWSGSGGTVRCAQTSYQQWHCSLMPLWPTGNLSFALGDDFVAPFECHYYCYYHRYYSSTYFVSVASIGLWRLRAGRAGGARAAESESEKSRDTHEFGANLFPLWSVAGGAAGAQLERAPNTVSGKKAFKIK